MESSGDAVVSEVGFRRAPQTAFEAEALTAFQEKEIYNIRIILDSNKICPCKSRQVEFQGVFPWQGQEIPIVLHICPKPECKCVEWRCPKGSGHVGGIFFSFKSFQKAPTRALWDL